MVLPWWGLECIGKMKTNKFFKIINLLFFVAITSGFALLGSAKWGISTSEPTLWIKSCASLKAHTWTTNNLEKNDAQLSSITSPTYDQVLQSVIDDYNNINKSHIRLAKYPDDPNNPGAPAAGDSVFTIAKGNVRTIDVCFSDSGPTTSGHAQQKIEGKTVTGCEIEISDKNKDDLQKFTGTLTHELGHCLGLDHPQETTNAIMSYFSPEKEIRLMIDDKMGLIYLYPIAGVDVKEENTLGLSCSKK